MSGLADQSGSQSRPKVYLALMIGPDMSGKTTFSKMALRYFRQKFPKFLMDLMFYEKCTSSQIIYSLKNDVIESISKHQDPESRKVIVVDAQNLHDAHNRFSIFQFCLMFDIIYLQVYMEFDENEVLNRCARRGLFMNRKVLQNPEFFNTTCIGSDPNLQWQNNSITISKNFKKDGESQIVRLYYFLLNCVLPPKNNAWLSQVPKVPLEYDNPHQLQMQAGISYKDKLLLGKGCPSDKKEKSK